MARGSDQPMSFAACRYQSARNGGIHRPSMSTMARCTNTGIIAGRCGSRLAVVSPNTIGCTLENTAANATPSESSSSGVAHGCSRIAVVRIRNSLCEDAEGRHAEDRERPQHQSPADGGAYA